VPDLSSIPVPFRDFLTDFRMDWAQSSRSQWFVRLAAGSYVTNNALLQQGTLPSTGATSHNNYGNAVIGNQFSFGPNWLGSLTLDASLLHLTMARNANLGYALAFPFSSTYQTISGFETFGDNQFVTPITAFPILRNQEKYQARYAVTRSSGRHSPSFGVDFIHEPVLSGALAANAESLTIFPQDPTTYLTNPAQFAVDRTCTPAAGLDVTPGASCTTVPAGNGSFSQNVQRPGLYALDSWRITPRLTLNYGIRYDTTFGLFTASGQSQFANPALATLQALQIPLFAGPAAPHDYRGAIAPRLGLAYALDRSRSTVLRAGFGLFYNDLAQVGWVTAFQAVNEPPGVCAKPGDPGCLPGAASGGAGALIDPGYKTPYALHATAGIEHAFNRNWLLSSSWVQETGMHGYRRYDYQSGYTLTSPLYAADPAVQQNYVPNISVFRSDNRSVYDALFVHLQGNLNSRLSLIVNYTLSRAYTWGCVLGELFDYVNGVCDPRSAFRTPGGFELSFLSQAESARPFTMTTPVDVNGFGDLVNDPAVVNGVQTAMDGFRGTPLLETDLRVTRPFHLGDRWTAFPFIEFFNLFNRNNPGANYVTNLAALPTPVNDLANATAFCLNPSCTSTQPITSLNQLRVPAGALGDFFGPGTTVGIPFAAQLGLRVTF
jgi:hypothetical protein